ncbi:MAG: RluA family pseudouridine synthase [Planctomycetes bacterium]|jgi:23S rRNA pseudouridine1911/1915/1917 synthase|nr:RluA family pseudouridine synthase [Planctomycetota bacterium]MCL4728947.1 RluA family pseudouridine synthase [Planctomycetota bacterium]
MTRSRSHRKAKEPIADLSAVETEREYRVELPQEGMRADKFLKLRTPWMSRTRVQETFDQGRVLRNGVPCPAGRKLAGGDRITLVLPAPHEDVTEMARIPYDVVHEDDVMLVVSKPPHLIVHPTGGYRYTTLLNALHLKHRGEGDNAPRLVNRIDKETSGLVLLGKTGGVTAALGRALADKDVVKDYLALVEGAVTPDHFDIDAPIAPDTTATVSMLRRVDPAGDPARTEVWVEQRLGRFTLVRCRLHTGRQHQIRVHMRHIGHPLVCDHHYGLRDELRHSDLADPPPPPTRIESPYGFREGDTEADVSERIRALDTQKRHEYEELCAGRRVGRGNDDALVLGRCALHSHYLKLRHPVSGRWLELTAPLPRDMEGAVRQLAGKNSGTA